LVNLFTAIPIQFTWSHLATIYRPDPSCLQFGCPGHIQSQFCCLGTIRSHVVNLVPASKFLVHQSLFCQHSHILLTWTQLVTFHCTLVTYNPNFIIMPIWSRIVNLIPSGHVLLDMVTTNLNVVDMFTAGHILVTMDPSGHILFIMKKY
jgi:hypothetical protein